MMAGGEELFEQIPEVEGVAESFAEEKVDYSKDLQELKFREKLNRVERLEHQLNEERSMLRQRQIYAFLLLGLSVVWLWFIGRYLQHFGEVTIASKVPGVPDIRPVSDSVIIALITTTTINVLGLFYIVARWLFPQKWNGEKKSGVSV